LKDPTCFIELDRNFSYMYKIMAKQLILYNEYRYVLFLVQ